MCYVSVLLHLPPSIRILGFKFKLAAVENEGQSWDDVWGLRTTTCIFQDSQRLVLAVGLCHVLLSNQIKSSRAVSICNPMR